MSGRIGEKGFWIDLSLVEIVQLLLGQHNVALKLATQKFGALVGLKMLQLVNFKVNPFKFGLFVINLKNDLLFSGVFGCTPTRCAGIGTATQTWIAKTNVKV
jgi:hypothetical protein